MQATIKTTQFFNCLGLMSGTSCDGIDLSVITTDGNIIKGDTHNMSYSFTSRQKHIIKSAYGKNPNPETLQQATNIITETHCELIEQFLNQSNITIDLIGFHGQTTYHQPTSGITIQIGDAQTIADKFNIPVVANFRKNDIINGGNGAPLIPIYHGAIANSKGLNNVCFLNLGGIANITICSTNKLIAFDTGPANCLIDDYCQEVLKIPLDNNGDLARLGNINNKLVKDFLTDKYFSQSFPKSLDRNEFKIDFFSSPYNKMNKNDVLATLSEYTAQSVDYGIKQVGIIPQKIIVCGGGANNSYIIDRLNKVTNLATITANDIELNANYIEAQGFAFMAVRRLKNMPISFPTTTGVNKAMIGGQIFNPRT